MSTKEKEIPVKITVDTTELGESIYANHVTFKINPLDASIVFCEISTDRDKPSKTADGLELKARSKIRIVLPHHVFVNLAYLMKDHAEKITQKDED